MIVLSAALLSSPLSWKTHWPNSSLIALQATLPGSTILLAMASASMTGTPSSLNMLDTVLFPVPTPPVSPTKYITVVLQFSVLTSVLLLPSCQYQVVCNGVAEEDHEEENSFYYHPLPALEYHWRLRLGETNALCFNMEQGGHRVVK